MSDRYQPHRLLLHDDGRTRWELEEGDAPRSTPDAGWRDHGVFLVDRWSTGIHPRDRRRVPNGAIAARPDLQAFGMEGPIVLYVDQRRTCRTCGAGFTFSARLQRTWYEHRRVGNHVDAARCGACRRAWRDDRAARMALTTALTALTEAPDDPAALLAAATATVHAADQIGHKALERALGYARKAERGARSARDRTAAARAAAALDAHLRPDPPPDQR
jgi:hypothetical protein